MGVDPDQADADVDAIGDWRDADDLHRLHGAENNDYVAAGYPYGPRDGPFETVFELEQVKGITRDLANRARPSLTVFSRHPFADLSTASRETLISMPGMDQGQAAAFLYTRVAQSGAGSNSQSEIEGTTANLADLTGRAFLLAAVVKDPALRVLRKVVVRFTGTPQRPYWVLDWH